MVAARRSTRSTSPPTRTGGRGLRARLGPGGQPGQRGQRLEERERALVTEEEVIPRPQRMEPQLLGPSGVSDDVREVRLLRMRREALEGQAESDHRRAILRVEAAPSNSG